MSRLTVLSWNLQAKAPAKVGLPGVLHRFNPDVVVLVEADADLLLAEPALQPWAAQAYIDGSAGGRPGMAILSRGSMREPTTLTPERLGSSPDLWDRPRAIMTRLDIADGNVHLVGVHAKAPLPFPPIHAAPRNRQLEALGTWITVQLAVGRSFIVAGDFNAVTCHLPRMTDVALALGEETPTWRPFLRFLPATLRLDRIFVSASITPVSFSVACGPSRSDHCPVVAVLDV